MDMWGQAWWWWNVSLTLQSARGWTINDHGKGLCRSCRFECLPMLFRLCNALLNSGEIDRVLNTLLITGCYFLLNTMIVMHTLSFIRQIRMTQSWFYMVYIQRQTVYVFSIITFNRGWWSLKLKHQVRQNKTGHQIQSGC